MNAPRKNGCAGIVLLESHVQLGRMVVVFAGRLLNASLSSQKMGPDGNVRAPLQGVGNVSMDHCQMANAAKRLLNVNQD